MSIDERIAEIAEDYFSDHGEEGHMDRDACRGAIRAALVDPVLRGEIENAAYERAAMVCTDVLTLSTFNEATVEAAMDCAAAIRALKK